MKVVFTLAPHQIQTLAIFATLGMGFAVLPGVYRGDLFAFHPLLMSIGFLGFMCEGILAAYRLRPTEGSQRVSALANHMWIQVAAIVCISLGFLTIYINKNMHAKHHFTSLHGKVGLVNTLAATVIAPALGAASFKWVGLYENLPEPLQKNVKLVHRLVAAITWVLSLVTMQLDLPHVAVFQGITCRLWQLLIGILGISMILLLRSRGLGKSILPTSQQGPKVL